MSWESAISAKANNLIFKTAWRSAQRARDRVEKLLSHFFEELVTVGIDVLEPPNLGQFTPEWEPLSQSWLDRKGGDESFYYHTGALERTLLRKSTTGVFGRPQVFLEWAGGSKKVDAGVAPAKYIGPRLVGLKIRVVPFPRLTTAWGAEELVAGGNETTFFKLTNPDGNRLRPLVSPFIHWYVSVRVRNAMKGLIA